MTLGEKITRLRTSRGMTQEEMAERLSVSRQSVSKWEMDQSLPQIDKILVLCELFGVSSDELLKEKMTISDGARRNKYFGTDGFRGEANVNLTSMQAYKVGRFLGWYYSSELSGCKNAGYRPRIVIGKDTRCVPDKGGRDGVNHSSSGIHEGYRAVLILTHKKRKMNVNRSLPSVCIVEESILRSRCKIL